MAVHIELHSISLQTATGQSDYDFSSGLNVVTGSYATGKSSLLELIKFGLGSKRAELMPEIRENLVRVELEATVGTSHLRLTRDLGQNRMLAVFLDEDDRPEQWSATRVKTRPLAGERLLQLMGVPSTRLPRRGTAGSSEPVSFFDFYRYIYLPQNDVSRSIAGHADPFTNRKRKAVFELAYGLANDAVRSLEVQIVALEQEKESAIAEADAVMRFLDRSGSPSRSQLDASERDASGRLVQATQQLEQLRTPSSAGSSDDQRLLRERVGRLRERTAAAESELAAARAAVAKGEAILAQLHLDRAGVTKEGSAISALATLDFVSCPRCRQSVDPEGVEPGCCYLCTQRYEPVAPSARQSDDVLVAQADETRRLLETDRGTYVRATREIEEARQELYAAASELEEQTDPKRVQPQVDAAVAASAEIEIARAHLRDVERYRDLWDQYEQVREEVTEQDHKLERARNQLQEERIALEGNFERLDDLSEIFDQEILGLGFAGYTGARVDRDSYLPIVNDREFKDLSVAGARKMLANVAYYMANLGYALSDAKVLMPSLLIIDGPRSSLGNTAEDVRAGQRIYYRLGLLAQAYPSAQIILADNGVPELDAAARRLINLTTLTYTEPLLRDVPHPGPESVETVGKQPSEPEEPGDEA